MEWKTTVRSIVAPIAPNRKVSRRCATAPYRLSTRDRSGRQRGRRFAIVFHETLAGERQHPNSANDLTVQMMTAKPKHKHRHRENDRGAREQRRRDKALDDALKDTFPASDPVSVEQPVLLTDGTSVEKE